MDTVWVVEEGSYSDYHVVGVFSTQENAQLVWDAIKACEHNYLNDGPTRWALDPLVDQLRTGLRYYVVGMLRDGITEFCRLVDVFSDQKTQLPKPQVFTLIRRSEWGVEPRSQYYPNSWPDYLDAHVWAKDAQGAIKATNEHRTMMIASREW